MVDGFLLPIGAEIREGLQFFADFKVSAFHWLTRVGDKKPTRNGFAYPQSASTPLLLSMDGEEESVRGVWEAADGEAFSDSGVDTESIDSGIDTDWDSDMVSISSSTYEHQFLQNRRFGPPFPA